MKKLIFALTGISMMLLGSCSQEWGGGNDPVRDDNTLALTVTVDDKGGSVNASQTRVEALPEEKTISSLYLLFFRPEGNSAWFEDYIEVTDIKAIGAEHIIDMSGTQLNLTAPYNILAIANIKGVDGARYLNNMSVESWMQQWAGKSEQEVIEAAQAWTTNAPVNPKVLLMSGSAKKAANQFKVDLTLVRNQIRFDVVNNADGYDLVSVAIYNAYPVSKIWNDGSSRGALDYTDGISRIESYYGYSDRELTDRFDDEELYGTQEIRGYFYVFENQVAMPANNDKLTTCLVVGLQRQYSTTPQYYRVNIAPEDNAQMLYRNHAYILTINSVLEDGKLSAIEALDNPEAPQLNYVINQWDVNEVGVSDQDGSSMLASPYKTVNIDLFSGEIAGRKQRGLPVREFDITTVSSRPASEITPLAIIGTPIFRLNASETPYEGIQVRLEGNTLVFTRIDTAPKEPEEGKLQSGDKITGSITLGYAGLRITIDVVQTDLVTDFLNIYLPEGGIPRFAPFANIESGTIRVEASGDWSARILSETTGFAFAHDNTLDITSWPVSDHEFKVKTISNNPDSQNAREAFVVVTLDKDPLNFSRVVRLTQQQKAEIAITPNQTVTFDGTFDGTSGNLAAIPNNTIDTFTVLPGNIDEGGTTVQNDWTFIIEAPDPNNADVWKTVYIEEGRQNIPEGVQDASLNWFKVTAVHDPALNVPNTFTVDVLGKNTTGANRRARIVTYLKSAGLTGAKAAINIVQNTSSISLSPNTVPAVPKTGGETAEVGIQADGTLRWKVESVTVNYGSGNKPPVKHPIEVLSGTTQIATIDGNTVNIPGGEFGVSDKFRVKFPKIYYPNRDIPISVTVKVGIVGSSLTSTMVFTQTALTSSSFYPAAPQTGGYGNIHGGSYNRYMRDGIRGMGTVTAAVNVNTNFYYTTTYGMNMAEPWPITNNFLATRDGLAMIVSDYDGVNEVGAMNNTNSPLRKAGYTLQDNDGTLAAFNTNVSGTKVYQLLVAGQGGLPMISTTANLYEDGISTQAADYPDGAVPIIVQAGTTRAFMVIDPDNRLIYLGESQFFDTVEGVPFAQNLMVYIKNAAIYGSHFTELMSDDENAPAAPWDATYWGANAGVSR
jgi:hypothetical protein